MMFAGSDRKTSHDAAVSDARAIAGIAVFPDMIGPQLLTVFRRRRPWLIPKCLADSDRSLKLD
jgi:hypothetical protein